MKSFKITLAAFALMAGAAFATVSAAKKKAEAPKKDAPAAVELKNASDSLSYTAGYTNTTQGLIPFIQQQLKVDTAYMADFIQGLKDAKDKGADPRFIAYQAGGQIASMINERIFPSMSSEVKDTPDSLTADLFYAGFIAALQKDTTKFKEDEAVNFYQKRMEAINAAKEAKLIADGKAWLEENAKKEGVQTTNSGLQYKVITMGEGAKPLADDEVEVKYEGKLIDGTVFDSSYKRNPQTTKFKANQVIKGWTEGLQLMPVGSKFEFYIPQELGYGSRATGQIPAFATLLFTVELVGITPKEEPKQEAVAPATPAKTAAKKPVARKK